MKKTRIVAVLICIVMIISMTACGNSEKEEDSSGSLKVVTTTFPLYDWTRTLAGENAENMDLKLLMESGVDLHSFQPSAEDIAAISECDIFVYVGGESDEWVKDALKEAENEEMIVIDLMEALDKDVKEEEIKEGMEAEEEEEGEEEGPEYDEHVWLSLKRAVKCCKAIEEALAEADDDNAGMYEEALAAYTEKLSELDGKYEKAVKEADNKMLLFGDRFPFRYMTDDYGLNYYAAFVGCSAESEASFETVRFLAEKLNEYGLKYIFTIENSDQKIAKAIINDSGAENVEILTLDSLQSVTGKDVDGGLTYLEVMENDLEVLKKALAN